MSPRAWRILCVASFAALVGLIAIPAAIYDWIKTP